MSDPVVTYLEQGDNEAQIRDLGKMKHLRPRLWAREYGSVGAARGTLALMHDHGEHGGRYSRIGSRFADDGWAVTVFDFRGHGDSDGELNGALDSPDDLIDDVDLAVQHVAFLLPEAPRVVVGTGLGGLAAIGYAMRPNVRCAGFVAFNPDLRPGAAVKRTGVLGGLFGGGTLGIDAKDRFRDASKAEAFAKDKKITLKRSGKTATAIDALRNSAMERAGSLDKPGLIVVSKDDRVCDPSAAREFAKRAGAGVSLIECDLGHAILDDAGADDVLRATLAWLDPRFPRGAAKTPSL
jgi:alpha-beta hydrolase superfamily lysophospholipase